MTRTAAGACDGWNPASGVGLTATEAAAARVVAGRRCDPLIVDPYAEPLVYAVGVEFFSRLAAGEHDESGFALPGMVDWVAVRSKFFDDYVTAAQSAGIRQVVILGAGLDSRAYRLSWGPGAIVYEVDLPDVLEFKTRTMSDLGVAPRADRLAVGADLRGDWAGALRRSGFDDTVPTAWGAEGLVPYLPAAAQDRLLDGISTLSPAGSRFAADTAADVDQLTARIAKTLGTNVRPAEHKLEIPADGAVSAQGRRRVAEHLRAHHWTATDLPAATLFATFNLPFDGNYDGIEFITATKST